MTLKHTATQSPPAVIAQALREAVGHQHAGRLPEAERCVRGIVQTCLRQADPGAPVLRPEHPKPIGVHARGGRSTIKSGHDKKHGKPISRDTGAAKSGPGPKDLQDLVALFDQQRYSAAATLAHMMTLRFPRHAFGWKVLGAAYKQLGRSADAIKPMQKAADLAPLDADNHANLGAALRDMGKLGEAEASCRRALTVDPRRTGAHINLANTLKDQGRWDEAEAQLLRAIDIRPDYAQTWNVLGNLYKDLGRIRDAEISYCKALELRPDYAEPMVSLVMLSLPVAAECIEESQEAPQRFDAAVDKLGAWLASVIQTIPANKEAGLRRAISSTHPFYLAYRDGNHVDALSRYADLALGLGAKEPTASTVAADSAATISFGNGNFRPTKKLKIVVVSGHFRRHSIWDVNLRGLLQHLDRSRFEIVLYHVGQQEDAETEFARAHADVWRDLHTVSGLAAWSQAMKTDRPDVVFYPEIGMDPTVLRLAHQRFAPIQAAAWGHPITTGLPTIDLFFSGSLLEPPGAESHYRERLLRLPGTGCCTTPIPVVPDELKELSKELAHRRGPRFLMAQMPFKFDPADDPLYADIAAAVGESTFILPRAPKAPWATDTVVARLSRAYRDAGLVPEEHLLVIPWLSRGQFWSLLDLSDIYLDCPSFSGYTTAWQAIQRGLPVVTLEGSFMRQRLAASLLRKIGQEQTIARSRSEYVSVAAALAKEWRDPQARDHRREALRLAAPDADNDVSVVRAFEHELWVVAAEKGLVAASADDPTPHPATLAC